MAGVDGSQVEYVKTKKIHMLAHGMIETVVRNREINPKLALTAFLLAGGSVPSKSEAFRLTSEQVDQAIDFFHKAEQAKKEGPKDGAQSTAVNATKPVLEPMPEPPPKTLLASIGLAWTQPPITSGVPPAARAGHAYCHCDGKIWVVGGNISGKFSNDTHCYNIATSAWESPDVKGELPDPRAGHTMVSWGRKLWLFGGADTYRSYFNDCFVFDTDLLTWHRINTTGKLPTPRAGHSAAVVDGRMWVFGGEDTLNCLCDVMVLDLGTLVWRSVIVSGDIPRPRGGHSCVAVGKFLWIFGGDDRVNYLRDLYVLNTETVSWSGPVNAKGEPPAPRGGHSACVWDHRLMILFSGVNDTGFLGNVAVLDLQTKEWRSFAGHGVPGMGPSACSGHTAALVDDRMFVFGGYDAAAFQNTTYCLAISGSK